MSKGKQHIDDLFRNGLKDLKIDPPPHVLDKIHDKINEQKKKRRLFIIRAIAAAAIIVIAFGAGYIINQKSDTVKISNQQTETAGTRIKPENKEKLTEEQTVNKETEEISSASSNEEVRKLPDRVPIIAAKEINTEVKQKDYQYSEKIYLESLPGIIAQSISFNNIATSMEVKPDLSSAKLQIASLLPALGIDSEPTNKTVKGKWSVSGQISPSYSYRNTQDGPLRSSSMESFDSQGSGKSTENALFSISGGMQMGYEIGNKWEVASGLYYSVNGIVTKDFFTDINGIYAINSSTFNNSIGSINFKQSPIDYIESGANEMTYDDRSFTNESTDLIQHFKYLEVPILIKHKIIEDKIGVHILGGVNTGFLVGNNAFFSTAEKTENMGSTSGIRKMSFNSILGIGINFAIIKKLSLNFEPSFKYSLRHINSGPENYYPYSLDFFTGLIYHF